MKIKRPDAIHRLKWKADPVESVKISEEITGNNFKQQW
jgi:hypothetical protein